MALSGGNCLSCSSFSEKRAESGWASGTYGWNSLGAAASELFITAEHVIMHNAAETFLFLWLKGICFWLVCNCCTWEYQGAVNLHHLRHECLAVTSENTEQKWPRDKRRQGQQRPLQDSFIEQDKQEGLDPQLQWGTLSVLLLLPGRNWCSKIQGNVRQQQLPLLGGCGGAVLSRPRAAVVGKVFLS